VTGQRRAERVPPQGTPPVAALVAAAWVLAYGTAQLLLRGDSRLVLSNVVYQLPIAAALWLTVRAAVRTTGTWRRFWGLIGLATALWLAGELSWGWYELVRRQEVPFPALPDLFYLTSYLPTITAFLLAFGGAGALSRSRALLDASVVALVVGAVGWQVLVAPQLGSGLDLAVLTASASPLLDLATLVLIGTLGFAGHRRVPGAVTAVMLAYACFALSDAAYTYLVVIDGRPYPDWLESGWQAAAVLVSLAGIAGAAQHDEPVPGLRPRDRGLPLVLAGSAVALGTVAADVRDGRVEIWVLVLAAYVIAAVIVRLLLTTRDKDRVSSQLEKALAEQERLAVTDGLTGLHNRRFFEEMLRYETERSVRTGPHLGLIVIDVDHFKSVNDAHGHQAGDDVLRSIAGRLDAAVRRRDVVARYGGEEFVVILPDADAEVLLELAERCRRIIADRPFPLPGGPALPVTVSLGVAGLPDHAGTAQELVRAADRALYLAKAAGRNRVQVGADLVAPSMDPALEPLRALPVLERVADLVDLIQAGIEHSTAVGRYSAQVAEAMGLSPETRRRCQLAGRLHDVGKIAVPPDVLTKPGPLGAHEWAMMRKHPEQGAWMIGLVPGLGEVSGIVREHHERFDGAGYPDGRAGRLIRLEARIVAVCDAWAAMLADRSYQPASSPAGARRVLRDGAGTQWDPEVVRVFLELEASGRLTPLRPLDAGLRSTVLQERLGLPVLHGSDPPA
jgi:two-component system, cell cycle response regulator